MLLITVPAKEFRDFTALLTSPKKPQITISLEPVIMKKRFDDLLHEIAQKKHLINLSKEIIAHHEAAISRLQVDLALTESKLATLLASYQFDTCPAYE